MTSMTAMRLPLAVGTLMLSLSLAVPAAAQMYPGDDVTVNLNAIGPAPHKALPPVHLHPPRQMRRHRSEPKRSEPRREAAPVQHRAPEPVQKAATTPAKPQKTQSASPAPTAIPFSMGGGSAPNTTPRQQAARPPAVQPPVARPAQSAPPRKAVASNQPLPKVTFEKGLTKELVVLFDNASTTLSDSSSARLNQLAFTLKTALANGADQVELVGYGGNPGDKSSAARRLSLKRALAVREALLVDGVPAGRIDVRALGGVPDGDDGATDRVDIFIKN